jgi:hypothetical protein
MESDPIDFHLLVSDANGLYKRGRLMRRLKILYVTFVILGCGTIMQNTYADENTPEKWGVLFSYVLFKGYRLLIDDIVLKDVETHEKVHIQPYKNNFTHRGFHIDNLDQKDVFVFQYLPAGRYYVSEVGISHDYNKRIKLNWTGRSIKIMPGFINYIGDIIITGNKKIMSDYSSGNQFGRGGINSFTLGPKGARSSVKVDIKPDIKRAKSFIRHHHKLFLGKKLVFNLPGTRPFLVDPNL